MWKNLSSIHEQKKTRKQCKTYFRQWNDFCQDRNFSLTNASISEGSEFLLMLYRKGVSYSVINTTSIMLSMILPAFNETKFGKHPIIACILKGIFRKHPALPRYMVTYDPDLVLNFLNSLPSWDNITLKWPTLKTVTILAHYYRDIDVNQ